jgi:hypothetical protein
MSETAIQDRPVGNNIKELSRELGSIDALWHSVERGQKLSRATSYHYEEYFSLFTLITQRQFSSITEEIPSPLATGTIDPFLPTDQKQLFLIEIKHLPKRGEGAPEWAPSASRVFSSKEWLNSVQAFSQIWETKIGGTESAQFGRLAERSTREESLIHSAELDWIEGHVERVKQHAGRWIAVGVNGIIAVGDSMREVGDKARAEGVEHPLLLEVPDSEIEGVIIL